MLLILIQTVITLTVFVLVIIKLYVKLRTTWSNANTCLVGKTVIITGANTGIGYYTALDFAKRGAKVILACRNEHRAEAAKTKITEATGNKNVVVQLLDLSSLQSIRDFCKQINETEKNVNILVNNAGAGGLPNTFTEDCLQINWQVNHFGPFLLTQLLLDKIKSSAPSRIVIVGSFAGKMGNLKIPNLNFYSTDEFQSPMTLYNDTKQANILFARELALRLVDTGVNVYALHPGFVFTEIFRTLHPMIISTAYFLMNLIAKTPEEGAQTTIHCALSKDLENSTGKLYENCKEITMYGSCSDMNLAKDLWKKCEELVYSKKPKQVFK